MLWDGTNRFSSLSEKTRKSTTNWRCHYKGSTCSLSHLKTRSVGPAGVWTRDLSLSADWRSSSWANHAAVNTKGLGNLSVMVGKICPRVKRRIWWLRKRTGFVIRVSGPSKTLLSTPRDLLSMLHPTWLQLSLEISEFFFLNINSKLYREGLAKFSVEFSCLPRTCNTKVKHQLPQTQH